jgi:Holliday junction resolvase
MSKGIARERQLRDWYLSRDYWVCRAAGSLGDADLVVLRAGERPKLVECKANAGSPFKTFGPKDRADLLFAAGLAGADAVLAHWPPRGKLRFYRPDEWPVPARERLADGVGPFPAAVEEAENV